ncbi:MAG: hypothetical protein HYS40_02895 [Gemmatimonadetes bacterium]|nr:hypothetical protein [Gemmatimonadota bacterium]
MKRFVLALALVAMAAACKKADEQPAQEQQMMSDTTKMMADSAKMMGDTAHMMTGDTTKKM